MLPRLGGGTNITILRVLDNVVLGIWVSHLVKSFIIKS